MDRSDAGRDGPPWTWHWWRCDSQGRATFTWIVLIHALALAGLVLFPIPGWGPLLGALALAFVGGLGTTVAYHRALAHRSVRLHPAVEQALIATAVCNGSGAPDTWTANHRLHHANAETERDISSPRIGGFWWSHLKWLWQAPQSSIPRWAPDLAKRRYSSWRRAQPFLLALSLFAGLPFGWAAFFWMGPIRLAFSLHAQCAVNSLAHMRHGVRAGEDSSVNLPWLALVHMFQGENWHQNHHDNPNSARLGVKTWQVDLGWWTVLLLERLGLATHVKRPAAAVARKG
jgi:stearoyl-CoA desaturase (delta-9 desaturase)